jgi:hypothetical protein
MGAGNGDEAFAAYVCIPDGTERFYIFKQHVVACEPVEGICRKGLVHASLDTFHAAPVIFEEACGDIIFQGRKHGGLKVGRLIHLEVSVHIDVSIKSQIA